MENEVGRLAESNGRKRESTGETREIGRETESSFGSPNSPPSLSGRFPHEPKGLLADPSQVRAEPVQRMQEDLAERQRKMKEIKGGGARRALPRNQATAPATEQAASPSPSPTPE